jgi:hypothetical protein
VIHTLPRKEEPARPFRTDEPVKLELETRMEALPDAASSIRTSGLTMEHAIGALEKELARESRPKGRDAPRPLVE